MQLSWIIVGGGIHGVHLALRLQAQARVSPDKRRIVDPAPALLRAGAPCFKFSHKFGLAPGITQPLHRLAVLSLVRQRCLRRNRTACVTQVRQPPQRRYWQCRVRIQRRVFPPVRW